MTQIRTKQDIGRANCLEDVIRALNVARDALDQPVADSLGKLDLDCLAIFDEDGELILFSKRTELLWAPVVRLAIQRGLSPGGNTHPSAGVRELLLLSPLSEMTFLGRALDLEPWIACKWWCVGIKGVVEYPVGREAEPGVGVVENLSFALGEFASRLESISNRLGSEAVAISLSEFANRTTAQFEETLGGLIEGSARARGLVLAERTEVAEVTVTCRDKGLNVVVDAYPRRPGEVCSAVGVQGFIGNAVAASLRLGSEACIGLARRLDVDSVNTDSEQQPPTYGRDPVRTAAAGLFLGSLAQSALARLGRGMRCHGAGGGPVAVSHNVENARSQSTLFLWNAAIGGEGGWRGGDGADVVSVGSLEAVDIGDLEGLDVEMNRQLVTRRMIQRDCGGHGMYRGGGGLRTELRTGLPEVALSADQFPVVVGGLYGGYPGSPAFVEVGSDAGGETGLLISAGGAGYGDPLDRSVMNVEADLTSGAISRHEAEDVYGVVLTAVGTVDASGTTARRDALRDKRIRDATQRALVQ